MSKRCQGCGRRECETEICQICDFLAKKSQETNDTPAEKTIPLTWKQIEDSVKKGCVSYSLRLPSKLRATMRRELGFEK